MTDNFKPPEKKGVSSCFSIFSISSITPMASVPVGVLCIQWRLATENAGRSNQSCFTSLDLFPQLGCKLASFKRLVALHRLAGKVKAACVRGNICLGGFSSPYRSSAYRQSDITFCCPKRIYICNAFALIMLKPHLCAVWNLCLFSGYCCTILPHVLLIRCQHVCRAHAQISNDSQNDLHEHFQRPLQDGGGPDTSKHVT